MNRRKPVHLPALRLEVTSGGTGSYTLSQPSVYHEAPRQVRADHPGRLTLNMTGTPNQVEWAGRIKLQVDLEFQRVAASFRTVAAKQDDEKRAETEVILTIVEEKRAEVMNRDSAGYFIHDWQEITDQVRQMIFLDPRYQAIQSNREARRARSQVSLENKL